MRGGSGAFFGLAMLALALSSPATAQAPADDSEKEIERYRQMIGDPMSNPGFLFVDRGEVLWKTKRGKNNVSLEQCDLGEGPGKLEGAFAKMPRYFKDADKVMEVEQRIVWCMDKLQGYDISDLPKKKFGGPGRTSDLEDLVAFVANKSSGMKISQPLAHPKEQEMYAVGEAMFFRRGGSWDFACSTCHAEDGKRIRLQGLPNLAKPGKQVQGTMGSWPAYRVSQSQVRTMQHRLFDCYRQMRWPAPDYLSDGLTALYVYMNKTAEGAEIQVPAIKR